MDLRPSPIPAQPACAEDVSTRWYHAHRAIPTRCRVPASVLASLSFQHNPFPLQIEWVREEHAGFFALLDGLHDPAERALAFHEYALARFWAHEPPDQKPAPNERARRGYISLLRGWGYDSNRQAGAVLKGWAEQRFGLRPIWHGHLLSPGEPDRDHPYLRTRLRGHLHGIGMQLDLLYTYCQQELERRHPDRTHLTLYRGCYDPEHHCIKPDEQGETVEFNCISSFTDDREIAWEFGSTVWRVDVPLSKIVLAPEILPPGLLQGEREFLVLGGDYRVASLMY